MEFKRIEPEKYDVLKCKDWACRSIIQTKDGRLFISSNNKKIEKLNAQRNGKFETFVLVPDDHNEWVRACFERDEVKSITDLAKIEDE